MPISQIPVDDLAALGEHIRIVDVREPDEWASGHITFARHVPLRSVPEHLDAFDGSPTYVICHAGGRSQNACEFAAEHGHDVVNVVGGMAAWERAGHPVVSGGPPAGDERG